MTGRVVELAGPAGAGKTTLVHAILGTDSGATAGLPVGRLKVATALAATAPVLATARATAPGRWWTTQELRGIGYLGAWRAPAGRATGLVLVDHGPVFRLAALSGFGPPMTRTTAFRRWWTAAAVEWSRLLHAVVWLDAPDDVLVNRIDLRDRQHRVRNADQGTATAFLERYREAYDAALDVLTRTGTPVLRVNTSSRTPDELADLVVAALRDPVSGRNR